MFSANGGVQGEERQEAVQKCDATQPGTDPELSGADGKTRNEFWILLLMHCNHSPWGARAHLC